MEVGEIKLSVLKELTYPIIKRIKVPTFKVRGKDYLIDEETKNLLDGVIIIEEKVDGKTYWEDKLELMEAHLGISMITHRIFYEDLKWRHTISYNTLPAWKIGFDIWDFKQSKFLNYKDKSKVFEDYGWHHVPLIGIVRRPTIEELVKVLETQSAYCDPKHKIEGIVVKNYDKQLFGKIVNPEFEDIVDGTVHPMRRKPEMNRLKF